MKHIPRKRFGQNFLVDRGVIEAIVRVISPAEGETLVEIGPGLGALTEPLMRHLGSTPLHVVELDRDLAARLRKRFTPERLQVYEADVLEFDFSALAGSGGLRVAGNLPYNISSPLLFHLMGVADRVRDQHFMLQKEVVDRMVAAPGEPAYGRLSVMLQVRYHMELLFDVAPESFDPPPKVTSAIVRMIPLPAAALTLRAPERFSRLVAQAFSQRRKMLRNTLATEDQRLPMSDFGLEPTARAEDIAPAAYIAYANALADRGA